MEDEELELEIPNEIKTAEDSRRVVSAIKSVAGDLAKLSADHSNVKKASDDLMKAVQVLQASSIERPAESVGSDERELSRYVEPDGSIRLFGGERKLSYAGKDWTVFEAGLLDDPDMACKWQQDLKRAVNRRNIARLCMKGSGTPTLDGDVVSLLARAPSVSGLRKGLEDGIKKSLEAPVTRAFTNTSAVGAEWIPEQFIPELYEAAQVRGDIRGQFQEISVSSDSFKRPRVSNTARPYLVAQITSDNPAAYTGSTPGTGEQSYTVPGMAVRILVDAMASEDSAVAAIPQLSRLAADTIQDGIRDAVINGDTTATHEDAIATWNIRSRWGSSGLGGSADHRRAWKGVRRQAVDRSTTLDMGSLQTTAGLLQLMALLGERALGNGVFFVSPEVLIQKLFALTEVITIDKFGPKAPIVSGQLAALFDRPIVPTRFVSADLAATGLYTGSGAKSGVAYVDASGYYFYSRRAAMVEIAKNIGTQHIEIVITIRLGFDTPDTSSAANVAWGYNWL